MGAFTENLKGVHVWNPGTGEHTLCGDAFDAPDSEENWEDGPFRETELTVVTCPTCVQIIKFAKTLRTRP